MNQLRDLKVISITDVTDDEVSNAFEVDLINNPLVAVLWNYNSKDVEKSDEVVASLIEFGSYTKKPHKLDLGLKN